MGVRVRVEFGTPKPPKNPWITSVPNFNLLPTCGRGGYRSFGTYKKKKKKKKNQ